MNNTAKTTDLRIIAGILLKIISNQQVSDRQLALAAGHFYAEDVPASAASFQQLVEVIVRQLPNNIALTTLAENNKQFLDSTENASERWALNFIESYIDALTVETLFSQPIVVGYARRIAGSPYDRIANEDVGFPRWMIVYTTEGRGIINTGTRQIHLAPGHLALFQPGSQVSYNREKNSDIWGHYWIAFHAENEWHSWLDWPKVGPQLGLLYADEKDNTGIAASFKLLFDNYSGSGSKKTELNYNLLAQIILRCAQLIPSDQNRKIDQRIKRAQSYIEDNFNESITIAGVANSVNMSDSSLSHLFKQQTGRTVLEWRDEKRMMHAARLLRSTHVSIAAIAAECGYESAAFFTRTFKRFLGYTPKDYRKL